MKVLNKALIISFFGLGISIGVGIGMYKQAYHSYYAAPELRPMVEQFFREAEDRGFNVPSEGLTVVLGDLEQDSSTDETVGMSFGHRTVWISRSEVECHIYGLDRDRLYIEYLVFHELGHALLHRDHANRMSVMNPLSESAPLYANVPRLRKFMIDELFLFYP